MIYTTQSRENNVGHDGYALSMDDAEMGALYKTYYEEMSHTIDRETTFIPAGSVVMYLGTKYTGIGYVLIVLWVDKIIHLSRYTQLTKVVSEPCLST